jgi:hypothetical protein
MALESTQPLTNEYQESSGGKARPVRRADNLTAICEPDCLEKIWEPRRLRTLGASMTCCKDSSTFLLSILSADHSGRAV